MPPKVKRDGTAGCSSAAVSGTLRQAVDFETVGAYPSSTDASDVLVKHREAIEEHLFDRAMGLRLAILQPTVTLYDLTNTYFVGRPSDSAFRRNLQGTRRRSAATAPLLTPGPDASRIASGFVRRSEGLSPRNVREHRTLAGSMLEALDGAGRRSLVRCMDRRSSATDSLCDVAARQRLPLSGGHAAQ